MSDGFVQDERGTSSLEFIILGVLVLVPLIYLVIALTTVQQHMLAADAAARHVARSITLATTPEQADARSTAVLDTIWSQYSLAPDSVSVSVWCTPAGVACPSSEALVHVEVRTHASLPFVGGISGLDRVASIPVSGEAVNRMSKAWSQ